MPDRVGIEPLSLEALPAVNREQAPGLAQGRAAYAGARRSGCVGQTSTWTPRPFVLAAAFHASRHTAASLLLEHGVPLEVVPAVLGHASLAITADVYARVSMDTKRWALETLSEAFEVSR